MEKRNLKSTGFPDTDREILQRAFNEEFSLKIDEELGDKNGMAISHNSIGVLHADTKNPGKNESEAEPPPQRDRTE